MASTALVGYLFGVALFDDQSAIQVASAREYRGWHT